MARIDAIYLEDPSSGSRRIVHYLGIEGIPISRDRVRSLMRRMRLRVIYQILWTSIPGSSSERLPCLVNLEKIISIDQVWATDITYILMRQSFCIWLRSWTYSPEMFSAGSCPTAQSRSSALMCWRWPWRVAAGQRSFIPPRVVNSPPLTSWAGCTQRISRSAGLAEGGATTTSWWKGSGDRSSMRIFISVSKAMAWRQKLAWLDSYAGVAM
jgi:hypothetical protein